MNCIKRLIFSYVYLLALLKYILCLTRHIIYIQQDEDINTMVDLEAATRQIGGRISNITTAFTVQTSQYVSGTGPMIRFAEFDIRIYHSAGKKTCMKELPKQNSAQKCQLQANQTFIATNFVLNFIVSTFHPLILHKQLQQPSHTLPTSASSQQKITHVQSLIEYPTIPLLFLINHENENDLIKQITQPHVFQKINITDSYLRQKAIDIRYCSQLIFSISTVDSP